MQNIARPQEHLRDERYHRAMNWSSLVDPARMLPLAFALIATYVLAGFGAARSFAQIAPIRTSAGPAASLPVASQLSER